MPGRLERPFRIVLADAAGQQHLARPVAQAGHRRGGQPAAGDDAPGRGVEPEHRVEGFRDGPPGRRGQGLGQGDRPAAPHRAEVDDRAVLVEDDEVDAVEPDGHTSAPASALASAPSRAAPRTKQASGGNEIVTV